MKKPDPSKLVYEPVESDPSVEPSRCRICTRVIDDKPGWALLCSCKYDNEGKLVSDCGACSSEGLVLCPECYAWGEQVEHQFVALY